MLNYTQICFSLTPLGEEFRVRPLRICPAAEIHPLCNVQILQVFINAASLFQKPGHDVRRINTGRVNYLPRYFLIYVQDALVDFWWRKEDNRLRGSQLSESHGSYI